MPVAPLFLLILIALFSGATAVSIVIARRAKLEHRTSFFPFVREVEGIKAARARVTAVIFLALTGVTVGGWVATQQNPDNILIARDIVAEPEAPLLAKADIALNNSESAPITEPTLPDSETASALVEAMEETGPEAAPVSANVSEVPCRHFYSGMVTGIKLITLKKYPELWGDQIFVQEILKEPTLLVR
jgi:hypothetical protein